MQPFHEPSRPASHKPHAADPAVAIAELHTVHSKLAVIFTMITGVIEKGNAHSDLVRLLIHDQWLYSSAASRH